MKETMSMVPRVSIRRDPRFNLENNWKIVEESIQECQSRGVLVTPLTVFDHGIIVGWFLHGWIAPPGRILYEYHKSKEEYILDYCI